MDVYLVGDVGVDDDRDLLALLHGGALDAADRLAALDQRRGSSRAGERSSSSWSVVVVVRRGRARSGRRRRCGVDVVAPSSCCLRRIRRGRTLLRRAGTESSTAWGPPSNCVSRCRAESAQRGGARPRRPEASRAGAGACAPARRRQSTLGRSANDGRVSEAAGRFVGRAQQRPGGEEAEERDRDLRGEPDVDGRLEARRAPAVRRRGARSAPARRKASGGTARRARRPDDPASGRSTRSASASTRTAMQSARNCGA